MPKPLGKLKAELLARKGVRDEYESLAPEYAIARAQPSSRSFGAAAPSPKSS